RCDEDSFCAESTMDTRTTTPSAPLRWLRDILLMAQPPLSRGWDSVLSPQSQITNLEFPTQISNPKFPIYVFNSLLRLPQHRHHLLMNPFIRNKQLSVIDRKLLSRKVRHTTTGFFDDHRSGSGVPGEKIHFPKSIHTAQCGVAHIQRGRAATPYGLALDQKGFELMHHRADLFPKPVGKSRHDQSAAQRLYI